MDYASCPGFLPITKTQKWLWYAAKNRQEKRNNEKIKETRPIAVLVTIREPVHEGILLVNKQVSFDRISGLSKDKSENTHGQ